MSAQHLAGVLADAALGRRAESFVQVAGPERTTLQRMTRRVLEGTGRVPLPTPLLGRSGAGFRSGRLLPDAAAEVHGPTFDAWWGFRN